MDDLKKIDLPSTISTQSVDPMMKKKIAFSLPIPKKTLTVLAALLLIVGAGFYFSIFLPAQKVAGSAKKTYDQAKVTFDAIKKQNVALAGDELKRTKEDLTKTQEDLRNISYMSYMPIIGGYYSDADHAIKAGFHGIEAGEIFIEAVKPYSDLLGLKGSGGSFVKGSAEQRIQTAILTMGKITPRIDDLAKSLEAVKVDIDAINANHFPPFFGIGKTREQIKKTQQIVDQGVQFVNEARPLIKILPALLGETSEKKYLILFQNDKELRPSGGFITAYAVFKIDKGVIKVDRSNDIYNLDNTISRRDPAPEPIKKYFPSVGSFFLRDSNLSPDFVESMKTFNVLYNRASGKVDVDGTIALDTHVLVSTIKILDDEVWASGMEFTTKNEPRCDCPSVLYKLESLISTPKSLDLRVTKLADVQAVRKDIIGSLLYSIMQKSLKSSPKKYWGPLFQDMVTQIQQKHMLIYLYNKDAQAGIESINAAGRIKEFSGDYFHINEANFSGSKANLFVKESVEQNYEVDGSGMITKTVTVNYKNPHPASDCNLQRGQLCLNSLYKDWVRVYVPKGSKLIQSSGSEVTVTAYEELGKTVFDGFISVRPEGAATLTFKYTIPKKAEKGSLPVLIQKQPGTQGNQYTIKIKGRQTEKFELNTDAETKVAL